MTTETARTNIGGCAWCNGNHVGLCPFVLEIEYHEHGGVKRVKLVEPSERVALGADVKIAIDEGNGHICGVDCVETVCGES